jgi:hypothetical protein
VEDPPVKLTVVLEVVFLETETLSAAAAANEFLLDYFFVTFSSSAFIFWFC